MELKSSERCPTTKAVLRQSKIRARRFLRVHWTRLIVGAASIAVLGVIFVSSLAAGSGQATPSRGQVCAQGKRAASEIQQQFGDHAPSKEQLAKLVQELCSREPRFVPGSGANGG